MSRHEFVDGAGSEWTVGWDEPMVTFFAQRLGADHELEDVAGDKVGDVTTVPALLERLDGRVELPAEVQRKLEAEAPAFTAAPIARAIAHQDQLEAHIRDGLSGPGPRAPEVER